MDGWISYLKLGLCVPDSVSMDKEVEITTHLWQS